MVNKKDCGCVGRVLNILSNVLVLIMFVTVTVSYLDTNNEYLTFKRSLRSCLLDGNVTGFQANSSTVTIYCTTNFPIKSERIGLRWLREV